MPATAKRANGMKLKGYSNRIPRLTVCRIIERNGYAIALNRLGYYVVGMFADVKYGGAKAVLGTPGFDVFKTRGPAVRSFQSACGATADDYTTATGND